MIAIGILDDKHYCIQVEEKDPPGRVSKIKLTKEQAIFLSKMLLSAVEHSEIGKKSGNSGDITYTGDKPVGL